MDCDDILKKSSHSKRGEIQFKEISEFQMIESATVPVIIALNAKSLRLVESLENSKLTREIYQKLQQFTVQIYPFQLEEIRE